MSEIVKSKPEGKEGKKRQGREGGRNYNLLKFLPFDKGREEAKVVAGERRTLDELGGVATEGHEKKQKESFIKRVDRFVGGMFAETILIGLVVAVAGTLLEMALSKTLFVGVGALIAKMGFALFWGPIGIFVGIGVSLVLLSWLSSIVRGMARPRDLKGLDTKYERNKFKFERRQNRAIKKGDEKKEKKYNEKLSKLEVKRIKISEPLEEIYGRDEKKLQKSIANWGVSEGRFWRLRDIKTKRARNAKRLQTA